METVEATRTHNIGQDQASGDVALASTRTVAAVDENDRAGQMMAFASAALRDPNVSEQKLEAVLRITRDIEADDARRQFNRALHAAQQEMPRVKRNGTIDLGEDKGGKARGTIPFATWEDVDTIVRPVMHRHGLSVTFSNEVKNEMGIVWTATHRHVAGHSEKNSMILPHDTGPGRSGIQAAGSTNSYAKRYLVEDFYNIVREKADDDGQAAGTKYITVEQEDELAELLRETKTDTARWLQMVPGVRSLSEIEVGGFTACKNSLLAKKAQLAAKAGQK